MFEDNNTVLVDIGNTHIKYMVCGNSGINNADINIVRHDDPLDWVAGATSVLYAAVGEEHLCQKVESVARRYSVSCYRVTPAKQAFGIDCAYQEPHRLGVDRWLTVLGVRLESQAPVAIIDLGTAATCDFVVGNKHLGGWIAPGFSTMRDALFANTSNIAQHQRLDTIPVIGNDTQSCVDSGCVGALAGMISNAKAVLEKFGSQGKVFLCGGDAELVLPHLPADTILDKTLVFKGLSRFITLNKCVK